MKEHAKVFWSAIGSASEEIRRLGAKPELYFLPEVYTELKRNGVRPGIDVHIIGCSNEREYFRNLSPEPATIDIRAEEIAARAVQQHWWRRQHPEGERFAAILEPKLVKPGNK
jgi:DNA-binding LacI/PurR family transcriptional regulator